jgi:hypothetical protein
MQLLPAAPLILTAALILVTPIFVTVRVAESGAADTNNKRHGLIIIAVYLNENSNSPAGQYPRRTKLPDWWGVTRFA